MRITLPLTTYIFYDYNYNLGMEASQRQTNEALIVNQIDQFRLSSAKLGREGFKVETVLIMMNNCSDRCELRYYESGI